MIESVQTSQSAATEQPETDSCPTPLDWQEVVRRFRHERSGFQLDLGGQPVRGATFGSGEPVYLLNPATGDMELFTLLAWRLRDSYRCCLADYPRPTAARRLRLDQAADSVLAGADHRGDNQFNLVTSGWGSLVALNLMLSSPDRVRSAVIVCGFAHRELTWTERGLLAWGSRCPGTLLSVPGWKSIQERNHRPWFPPYDETRWRFLLENLGATSVADAARRLAVLPDTDLRSRLPEIKTPVLIVRTEGEGALLTGCQHEMEARLSNSRMEWLHTSGQYSCLTHPHRLAKLVTTFLDDPCQNREGAVPDAGGAA